jgi:hypothetical protein
MDWFKILVVLVLAFLLYKELTRTNKISIENMSSDSFMEMTPNGVRFTQPVTFASTVTGNNMTMANIKTNQLEKASGDKITIKDNLDINNTTNFTGTATFKNDVNADTNLYVGTGTNKWHMRDTRLGITGKFDFVPGFTTGSTANDNWIRILNYNSKDAGQYYDVGLAARNLYSAGRVSFGGKSMGDEGVAVVFRGSGIGDRIAIWNAHYKDL